MNYDCLGTLMLAQGELETAQECYKKELQIYEDCCDNHNDPSIATSYMHLGLVQKAMGNFTQAREYYDKALKIYLIFYQDGKNSNVAKLYNNFGNLENDIENHQEAQKLYEKAVENYLGCNEEKHPGIATCLNNLATAFELQGNFIKAFINYNKALAILSDLYPENNHPSLASVYNNMGLMEVARGQSKQAIIYFEKSLNIRLKCFKEPHQSIAATYLNLGDAYLSMEKWDQALDVYTNAKQIYQKINMDKILRFARRRSKTSPHKFNRFHRLHRFNRSTKEFSHFAYLEIQSRPWIVRLLRRIDLVV